MKHSWLDVAGRVSLSGALAILLIANSPLLTRAGGEGLARERTQAHAQQLWEQAIAAKGGRERLRRITSLYIAAELGGGFRKYMFSIFPNYRFEYSNWAARERTDLTICNEKLDRCWWQLNGDSAKPRKTNEDDIYLNLLPQFIFLMESSDLRPIPVRSRKGWNGLDRMDIVEADANGWRLDYYLNSKTHLPIKVVLPNGPVSHAKGEMNQEVSLSDYTEVDGLMLPRSVKYAFTTNPVKRSDRLTFEINPAYDPQIFEQSPTQKLGPEDWRSKRGLGRRVNDSVFAQDQPIGNQ
jgi:hypothetical protein